MKHVNFVMKLLCLALVLGILWQYQQIAASRNSVLQEYEAEAAEINAYNEAILQKEAEAKYVDGVYEGTGTGFGGNITVAVTIEEDTITQIEVLSAKGEDPAYYSQAETVLKKIVEQQDTAVDTVSGATYSSRGLIAATEQALEKAVK